MREVAKISTMEINQTYGFFLCMNCALRMVQRERTWGWCASVVNCWKTWYVALQKFRSPPPKWSQIQPIQPTSLKLIESCNSTGNHHWHDYDQPFLTIKNHPWPQPMIGERIVTRSSLSASRASRLCAISSPCRSHSWTEAEPPVAPPRWCTPTLSWFPGLVYHIFCDA